MHTESTDIIISLDQFLVTEILYCCIFIMFEIITEWKFNLQIWVIMKENDAENKIIIIKLECTVIEDDKITALLLSSENLLSSIKNILKMWQININDYIYQVNILFWLKKVFADCLWVNMTGFSEHSLTLIKLWVIFELSELELYVCSSAEIFNIISEFLEVL